MANKVHVEIAKQGSAAIAAFKRAHPMTVLDASGADLAGVDLSESILINADLSAAILAKINLSGANLTEARF